MLLSDLNRILTIIGTILWFHQISMFFTTPFFVRFLYFINLKRWRCPHHRNSNCCTQFLIHITTTPHHVVLTNLFLCQCTQIFILITRHFSLNIFYWLIYFILLTTRWHFFTPKAGSCVLALSNVVVYPTE